MLLGQAWGDALWAASGAISVYVSIILWFTEREYVYPAQGALLYYTVYWGFFVYWGVAALVYAALRLAGVTFLRRRGSAIPAGFGDGYAATGLSGLD